MATTLPSPSCQHPRRHLPIYLTSASPTPQAIRLSSKRSKCVGTDLHGTPVLLDCVPITRRDKLDLKCGAGKHGARVDGWVAHHQHAFREGAGCLGARH
jgi:hypothetical protein